MDRIGDTPEMTSASWLDLTSGVQMSWSTSDNLCHPGICLVTLSQIQQILNTYTRQGHLPQSHLCAVKVEEIHQFDRPSLSQGGEIDPLGLIVELDFDRVDLDVLCESVSWSTMSRRPPTHGKMVQTRVFDQQADLQDVALGS